MLLQENINNAVVKCLFSYNSTSVVCRITLISQVLSKAITLLIIK